MKMIDLFSGAGGLSTGLEQAGFDSVFATEIVAQYAATYALNHQNTEVCVDDIRKLNPLRIRESLRLERGQLDLIAGGPPCQGFSINAPIRSSQDPRNHLFKDYLRFVKEFHPKAVLIENVPGLVSFRHGDTLRDILETLRDLGYSADVRILGAPFYGVPQMRWRTIIVGFRDFEIQSQFWPKPVFNPMIRANFTTIHKGKNLVEWPSDNVSKKFVTLGDAISDLPKLENGERGARVKAYRTPPKSEYQRQLRQDSNGVYNHEAMRLSPINMRRLEYIQAGGNWTDIPLELLPSGMRKARRSDHTKRYGRTCWNQLSSTILTKCDPHWGAFFHPEQNRAFTVREAARIQSFPDRYIFSGSQADQFAQVGNAVPPLLAQVVGISIRNILQESNEEIVAA